MKRIAKYGWHSFSIGMTSRFDVEEGLVLIPFDHETGQLLFRWEVEK